VAYPRTPPGNGAGCRGALEAHGCNLKLAAPLPVPSAELTLRLALVSPTLATGSATGSTARKRRRSVLTLTSEATAAIEGILAAPELPEEAGIRIAATTERSSSNSSQPAVGVIEMTIAEEPAERDEVIEEGGARVFVEGVVADALNEKILDAQIVDERVQFSLGEQT
jgi:Fe-S cluster assembly iron-binding protein IscA